MQYLKYTHVDYRTRRSVADFPPRNGPDFPHVPGLTLDFALESEYPTPIPTFFGTIDTSVHPEYNHQEAPIWGIISVLTPEEYQAAKHAEMLARKEIYAKRIDELRDGILSNGYYFEFSDQPGIIQTRNQRDMDNIHKNGSAALALVIQNQGTTPMEFRDSEDFIHQIPATEMLAMTMAVMQFGSQVYRTAWDHKDNIFGKNGKDPILTLEELVNYSYHSDWPRDGRPIEEPEWADPFAPPVDGEPVGEGDTES